MGVATALGIVQALVSFQTVDDEITVENGAENIFGHIGAPTITNRVDGGFLTTEDPQPGTQAADAPAGFVGMDDLGPPQVVEQRVVSGTGHIGQALLGANQGSRANLEVTIAL